MEALKDIIKCSQNRNVIHKALFDVWREFFEIMNSNKSNLWPKILVTVIPFRKASSSIPFTGSKILVFFSIKVAVWILTAAATAIDYLENCDRDSGYRGGGWRLAKMLRLSYRKDKCILPCKISLSYLKKWCKHMGLFLPHFALLLG